MFTHLLDHRQALAAQDDEWPRRGFSPTSLWTTGQETLDGYRIEVPPDMGPGRYTLAIGLYRRADSRRLAWSTGRDRLDLGTVKVRPPTLQSSPFRATHAGFGPAITLVGFDDPPVAAIRPGTIFELRPRWRAEAPLDRDYTVFVHLVDATGKLAANGDAPPLGGAYPTSLWERGEVIADRYQVAIPPDLTGRAHLLLGLYRPDTGERLRTETGADSIVAAELDLSP